MGGDCDNIRVLSVPQLGSGARSGTGQKRYSMIEKQLLAIYSVSQAVEPITQTAEVIVKTTLPIQG